MLKAARDEAKVQAKEIVDSANEKQEILLITLRKKLGVSSITQGKS